MYDIVDQDHWYAIPSTCKHSVKTEHTPKFRYSQGVTPVTMMCEKQTCRWTKKAKPIHVLLKIIWLVQ